MEKLEEHWCSLNFHEQRERLAAAVREGLGQGDVVQEVVIESGPSDRRYDLVAMVQTAAGRLRAPLWSHGQATIFCDPSIHPANRAQVGPATAVDATIRALNARLAVAYHLESRGLTFSQHLEEGVERTWTAEHSRFRKRTAVSREDVVTNAADVDVRDLLAHFYEGPSLRLVGEDGEAFLLPAAAAVEGPLVTLCSACRKWSDGSSAKCPECGSDAVDQVVAARPPRR